MQNEVLDFESGVEVVNHSVRWWEKKRKVYNIMLVGIASLLMVIDIMSRGFIINLMLLDILEAAIWIFGANVFFSLGLGVELVINHYRKKESENLRNTLFISGLLFSGLWTLLGLSFNSFY